MSKEVNMNLIFQGNAFLNAISLKKHPTLEDMSFYTLNNYAIEQPTPKLYFRGNIGQYISLFIDDGTKPLFYFVAKIQIGHKIFMDMTPWICCSITRLLPGYNYLGMTARGTTAAYKTLYNCVSPIQPDVYCMTHNPFEIQGYFKALEKQPGLPIALGFQGRNDTFDIPVVFPIPIDAQFQLNTLPSNTKIYTENGELDVDVKTPLYYMGSYGHNLGNNLQTINYKVYKNGVEECSQTFQVFNCYKGCKSCNTIKAPTDAKHMCTECFKMYAPDPKVKGNCILSPKTIEIIDIMDKLKDSGIDIFNPEDPFFTSRCVALPFPSEVDIPKKDRIKNYLISNNTFCPDTCHFIEIDYTTKEPKCDCTKEPPEINDATFNEIKDNFLSTLSNSNYDVIFCYMLVFNSIIFPKNIGSWLMIGVGLGTLGNIIYSFMKSMKLLTETVEGICKTLIGDDLPIDNNVERNKQLSKSQKVVDTLAGSSVRQQMKSKMNNKGYASNHEMVKPSPPPREDQPLRTYDKKQFNNNNHSNNILQQQGQSLINQSRSPSKYNGSQYIIPEENSEIPINYNKARQPFANPQFSQQGNVQSFNQNQGKCSPVNKNKQFDNKQNSIGKQFTNLQQYQSNIPQNQSYQPQQYQSNTPQSKQSQYQNHEQKSLSNQTNLQAFQQQSNPKQTQPLNRPLKNNQFNNLSSNEPQYVNDNSNSPSKMFNSRRRAMGSSNNNNLVSSNKSPTKKSSSNTEDITIISQIAFKSKQDDIFKKQNSETIKTPKSHSDTNNNTSVDYDEMDFDDLITKDQRHFCLIYWFYLKSLHPVIDSFIIPDPTIPKPIKISLFIMGLILDLFLTAFFYSDKYISNNYNNEDSGNFFYDLPVSIYTYLVTSVIGILLSVLSNTERELKKIENCSTPDDKLEQSKKFLKYYNIRLMIFNILQIVLILFFWYYIAAFCAVYLNSQDEYLSSYGVSLGISMLMPFAICLVLTGIHMLIIKYKWKWLYKVLSVLTWFC